MTKPNVKALLEITDAAETVHRNASMLKQNIKNRRVTHTTQVIRHLVNAVARVSYAVEDEATFLRALETALLEAQIGPTEMQITNGTEVFIQGAFSIEKLQQLIVVATVPPLVRS
jgi:hypothetical protein